MKSTTKFVVFRNKFDETTIQYCRDIVAQLEKIPDAQIYAEESGIDFGISKIFNQNDQVDYAIVVGGDGTMTHAASRFINKSTPPIFGIGKGNSYILYNYRTLQLKEIFPCFIQKVLSNSIAVDKAIRLKMTKRNLTLEQQGKSQEIAMSQILVHRGKNPSSLRMEIFINGILLTTFFGDGMIFSTPMGSLGYSLSSSGPILNYETSSIIIVPICPLSLSFRPICIPDTSQIKIRLLQKSRSSGVISCDGRSQIQFLRGQEIVIQKDNTAVNIVTALTHSKEAVWIDKLKSVLKWGNEFCS